MDLIHIIGFIAQFFIAVSLAPQVIKAWKTKSTEDISIIWNSVFVFGLLLFLIYAIGINEMPLILGASLEAALAIFLLIIKVVYK